MTGLASVPVGKILDKYGMKKAMLLMMTIELLGVLFFGLAWDL